MDRELIAYAIIMLILLVGTPIGWFEWRKRQRDKLRRRGIKRYSH